MNGADGIGTAWMTKLPNYNPREIVENIKRLIAGEECRPMVSKFCIIQFVERCFM